MDRSPFGGVQRAIAVVSFMLLGQGTAIACGAQSDCTVNGGNYRIAMPAAPEAARPGAIVYLHGWQGTPEGVMRFAALRGVANDLGVALIAPRGEGKSWNLPGVRPGGRADIAFIERVAADATERFNLDAERFMVAGFSLGGSMAWYIGCDLGERFAGYTAISGAFWEPYVENCVQPAPDLFHVHGLNDDVVPMEGRALSHAVQGDVRKSFDMLARFGACEGELEAAETSADLACERQTCGATTQTLCLHEGGHSVRPSWIAMGWAETLENEASSR